MKQFKAKQKTISIEERYIDAETKEEALELINYEDAGCDSAHFETIEDGEWVVEEANDERK